MPRPAAHGLETLSAAAVTDLLVLQPTAFCNLDCGYCYLPNRSDRRRLPMAVLERTLQRLADSPYLGPQLTIAWHAGEPLTAGLAYFEEAFRRVADWKPPWLELRHSIQTNATLIDARWTALFLRHGVQVGVSIDGPRPIHDARRKNRGGGGSFDRTLRGIDELRRAGVPFHAIAVLTADSVADPDRLIDFFLAQGIGEVGFNIDEAEGEYRASSFAEAGGVDAFAAFFRRVLARLDALPPGRLVVREIEGARAAILAPRPGGPDNGQVAPMRILTVDTAGNVYTYSPELAGIASERFGDFAIGNVGEESLVEMTAGQRFRRLRAEIDDGVRQCRAACPYFVFCGGGAPANKYFETGTFAATETVYCRLTRRSMIDVVLAAFEQRLGMTG